MPLDDPPCVRAGHKSLSSVRVDHTAVDVVGFLKSEVPEQLLKYTCRDRRARRPRVRSITVLFRVWRGDGRGTEQRTALMHSVSLSLASLHSYLGFRESFVLTWR